MPESFSGGRLAYRPGEAAAACGVTRNFIYTQMAAGALPTVKVGRARMILCSDLIAWLERHRDTPLAG